MQKTNSLTQLKPRISSNFIGQRCRCKIAKSNKGDKVGGSPSASKTVTCIKNRSPAKRASSYQATATRTAAAAGGDQGQAPAAAAKTNQPAPAKTGCKRTPQGLGYDTTRQGASAAEIPKGNQKGGTQKLAKTIGPQGPGQSPQVPGVLEKSPYDETGHRKSAAQISRGAQGGPEQLARPASQPGPRPPKSWPPGCLPSRWNPTKTLTASPTTKTTHSWRGRKAIPTMAPNSDLGWRPCSKCCTPSAVWPPSLPT